MTDGIGVLLCIHLCIASHTRLPLTPGDVLLWKLLDLHFAQSRFMIICFVGKGYYFMQSGME